MMNKIVVGIDVAKEFSYFCAFLPNGDTLKPFKVKHTLIDLEKVSKKLKEMEDQFHTSCVLIMESTGHYSGLPAHFFHSLNFEVFLINPIQSNSIKNIEVRKVKNDKIDAQNIALLYTLGKVKSLPFSPKTNDSISEINLLCRQFFSFSDTIVFYKNHLTSLLDQAFPHYTNLFDDVTCPSSMYILENFPTPDKFLSASKDDIILNLKQISHRGLQWASKKYCQLLDLALSSKKLSYAPDSASFAISIDLNMLKVLFESRKALAQQIEKLSATVEEISLLTSIEGVGVISAATFYSEIRDINNFKNIRKLTAFSGLDCTIRQSGKFKSSNNKMSKRGSRFIRRVLFTMVLTLIRKTKSGRYLIPYFADYYHQKCKTKPKKVAIGFAMNKLLKYFFSILKSKQPFKLIEPQLHAKNYSSVSKAVA